MTFYEEHYFGNFVADGFSEDKIFFPDFLLFNLLSNMPLKRRWLKRVKETVSQYFGVLVFSSKNFFWYH